MGLTIPSFPSALRIPKLSLSRASSERHARYKKNRGALSAPLRRTRSFHLQHSSREENAVLLAAKHGKQVPRGIGRFRLILESRLRCGPLDGGRGGEKRALGSLRAVVNFRRRSYAVPFNVECDGGTFRENTRDEGETQGALESQAVGQRIRHIVVVKDFQVSYLKASLPLVEIDCNRVFVDLDHPKHAVRIDMHVVIMDLVRECSRSSRIGVDVKSNKGERALMLVSVRPHERPLAEAHVRLVRQGSGNAGGSVRSCAASADVRQAHEPVEVVDLGWVVDIAQGRAGLQRVMVNEDPKGSEGSQAPGNRSDQAAGATACVIVAASERRLGT